MKFQLLHYILQNVRLLLLLIFISSSAYSQQNFKFKNITTDDGLPQNTIQAMCMDKTGFMWFGTNDGLCRFDGYNYLIFKHDDNDSNSIIDNRINVIFCDNSGKLWIGTERGLDVFNEKKNNFKHYVHNYFDKSTISNTVIWSICEDRKQNLWVSTFSGLNRFEHEKNRFFRYWVDSDYQSFSNDMRCVIEASNGRILVGTNGAGIFQFDRHSDSLVKYNIINNRFDLSSKFVKDFVIDSNKSLWIVVFNDGLYKYSLNGELVHFLPNPNDKNSIASNKINAIRKDSRNNIWVLNEGGGLNCYDQAKGTFCRISFDGDNKNSISSNTILSFSEDLANNLWFGSDNGVNYLDRDARFEHYKLIPNNKNSLTNNNINCFYKDSKGTLWIGTNGGGLCIFDEKNKTITPYQQNKLLGSDAILNIKEDKKENLWLSTWGGGMVKINLRNKGIKRYKADKSNPNALKINDIIDFEIDSQNNLWIGTFGEGLAYFNHTTETFQQFTGYPQLKNEPKSPYLISVFIDSRNYLWLGSISTGILRLNLNALNPDNINLLPTRNYFPAGAGPEISIIGRSVFTFFEDRKKDILAGTDQGLHQYNPDLDTFYVFREKDGLPNNVINSIQQDGNNNLWMGTNKGLCCYNTITKRIKIYNEKDGLQRASFSRAAYSTPDGTMFFGGSNGFNVFRPDYIRDNVFIPPIVITDFKIYQRSVATGEKISGRVVLKNVISQTKEIVLGYDQSMIGFEFAALSYTIPEKNQYAYYMDGFDKEWHYVGTDRHATYTNLAPGTYTFTVKGSNNDGIWNERGASVKITIEPPLWLTWWAYLIYAALLSTTLLFIFQATLRKERKKNKLAFEKFEYEKKLELERMEFNKAIELEKKTHEIDQLKLNFFTNISHEFRTPLTLILGPLEYFYEQQYESNWIKNEKYFVIMKRNADKLLHLINKVLDIRKLESGLMNVSVQNSDIVLFMKILSDSFLYRAEHKNIKFTTNYSHSIYYAWFDADIVDKIIFNLLSNAFKFTLNNGIIQLKMVILVAESDNWILERKISNFNINSDFVKVSITDNGIGIQKELQEKIFERFYQANNFASHSGGSGIGLALVKELVSMLNGKIELESEVGKGCSFTVWLPINIVNSKNEETSTGHQNIEMLVNHDSVDFEKQDLPLEQDLADLAGLSEKPLILVVEDNLDMGIFISNILQNNYNIETANNGKVAIEKAIERIPDLILSDIMMPELNGIEMSNILKNDERTSHIPIILLTARTTEEFHIEGLQTGIEDYITKPFNAKILQLKVNNVIKNRRLLREKFSLINNKHNGFKSYINYSSLDNNFIQKVTSIVEKHIDDPDFYPQNLADEIAMSRLQLYRKLKAVTNKTVNDFIFSIRLNSAANMLLVGDKSISEVSFHVGFRFPAHFSKLFSKQFGVTPSRYIELHKK